MYANHEALAPSTIVLWSRGGLDTLVKVAPIGTRPDPARTIGYCTTLKFLVGRRPAEMEAVVRLEAGISLIGGVEIFAVSPLPSPAEFKLTGYSRQPVELSPDMRGHVSHPTYPPGRGAPQWLLAEVSQERLVWIATVQRDKVFSYEAKRLPPIDNPDRSAR